MIMEKILPRDPVQRLQFSENRFNILQKDLAMNITSGKVHFHIGGHINQKN